MALSDYGGPDWVDWADVAAVGVVARNTGGTVSAVLHSLAVEQWLSIPSGPLIEDELTAAADGIRLKTDNRLRARRD